MDSIVFAPRVSLGGRQVVLLGGSSDGRSLILSILEQCIVLLEKIHNEENSKTYEVDARPVGDDVNPADRQGQKKRKGPPI